MPQDKKKKEQLPPGFVDPFEKEEELPPGFVDPIRQSPSDIINQRVKEKAISDIMGIPGVQQTISTISPALDLLSRPSYSVARFADALADDSKGVLDALSESWDEFTGTVAAGTRKQITFSDVIRRRFPEFGIENPKATQVLGFVGDVAFDPTSYLGFGLAKEGIVVGGKVLTKATREVLEEGLEKASRKVFVAKNGTLELVESFPKIAEKAKKAEEALTKRITARGKRDIDETVISQGTANKIITKLNVERDLKNAGYFDAVRAKQDEIEKLLNRLSGDPNTKLAETIAKTETLKDLKRVAENRLPNEMFEDEVRERINSRIASLTALRPELKAKFFDSQKGLYLKVGVPFGKNRDVVRLIGLDGVSNRVKSLSSYIESSGRFGAGLVGAGRNIAGAFNRNFGLPEEYIRFRDDLENELGYLSDEIVRVSRKLFRDVDEKGREKIGETMHWADEQTRLLEELRAAGGTTISDDQAAQVMQRAMDKFKLNDIERSIVAQMQQHYKEAALLEMRAGLLKGNLINYSPRGYEIIESADDMSLITRGRYGSAIPQPYLASSNQRKFLTKAEAEAAGLVPELDAALLYAHRLLSSRRALAINQFKESITDLFGTYTPRSKIAHTGILPTAKIGENLPEKIVADMKMIGEAVYPSGINPYTRSFARAFDKMQRFFKRSATVYRPSFGARQLISNTFQAALTSGVRAFKALDPRVAIDAGFLMMRRGKPLGDLPPFLTNFISKHFTGNQGLDAILASRVVLARHFGEEQLLDLARQYKLRSVLGQTYSGEELFQLARENGILRGFDSTGEAFSTKLTSEITKEQNSFKNVVGVLGKWANHAAMVEDYSRTMLFLNGIRMGYTAKDATKLVNKALFDYSRGLSEIERTWIRRFIPFYSYQRFALPYIIKQTLAKPGDAATLDKVMRTVEKLLISGEELNPGEVDIFNEQGNNFILEQPRNLSGFSPDGKATINLLNNLTPYDILNLAAYDNDGNIDPKMSVQKTFMAAITPFIKVPLQWVFDKDFFTNKTIEQSATYGNLDGSLGKVLPEFVKDAISWETRKHAATGKVTTYINPYMGYYVMQFIPALRDYIKPLEDFQAEGYLMGPMKGAARIILESTLPFKQRQIDLKEMGEYSLLKTEKEAEEIQKAFYLAELRGSQDQAVQAEEKLTQFLKVLAENSKNRQGFNIRGQGIGGVIPQGTEPPTIQPVQQEKEFK